MGLAVIVIANDFSAINVALPVMEKDFGADVNTLQWVINAYALTFGVLIVTAGRLADLFGRREAFFARTLTKPEQKQLNTLLRKLLLGLDAAPTK